MADFNGAVSFVREGDSYLGSVTVTLPSGEQATIAARIPRHAVIETVRAIKQRLLETAPAGVAVGAWVDPFGPKHESLVKWVATEQLKTALADKLRRDGSLALAPWYGEWTLNVADQAHALLVAARAGDEVAQGQVDGIARAAQTGEPRAVKAYRMFGILNESVKRGQPRPSELAAQGYEVGRGPDVDMETMEVFIPGDPAVDDLDPDTGEELNPGINDDLPPAVEAHDDPSSFNPEVGARGVPVRPTRSRPAPARATPARSTAARQQQQPTARPVRPTRANPNPTPARPAAPMRRPSGSGSGVPLASITPLRTFAPGTLRVAAPGLVNAVNPYGVGPTMPINPYTGQPYPPGTQIDPMTGMPYGMNPYGSQGQGGGGGGGGDCGGGGGDCGGGGGGGSDDFDDGGGSMIDDPGFEDTGDDEEFPDDMEMEVGGTLPSEDTEERAALGDDGNGPDGDMPGGYGPSDDGGPEVFPDEGNGGGPIPT